MSGFCTAAFWSSLACESAKQKPRITDTSVHYHDFMSESLEIFLDNLARKYQNSVEPPTEQADFSLSWHSTASQVSTQELGKLG